MMNAGIQKNLSINYPFRVVFDGSSIFKTRKEAEAFVSKLMAIE